MPKRYCNYTHKGGKPLSIEIEPGTEPGTLYLVGTPIGNLEDMSYRAVRVLKEVDIVAAEDTRQTRKLVSHFEISNNLTSYHEHNKREKGPKLIEEIKLGKNIALVTDAGMPGISDPGVDLIRLAIDESIKVVPIPGPTAAITALVVSGLDTDRFVFEGFLPRRKKELKQRIELLVKEERTIILYEAPHRLIKTLEALKVLENRKVSVVRELTKKFEEVVRGTFEEVLQEFKSRAIKGEFVIVLEGYNVADEPAGDTELDEGSLILQVDNFIAQGMTKKEAFKEVAKAKGIPKRNIYEIYLNKQM